MVVTKTARTPQYSSLGASQMPNKLNPAKQVLLGRKVINIISPARREYLGALDVLGKHRVIIHVLVFEPSINFPTGTFFIF